MGSSGSKPGLKKHPGSKKNQKVQSSSSPFWVFILQLLILADLLVTTLFLSKFFLSVLAILILNFLFNHC